MKTFAIPYKMTKEVTGTVYLQARDAGDAYKRFDSISARDLEDAADAEQIVRHPVQVREIVADNLPSELKL